MTDTPIYDELLAERGHPPVCAACGDYALHLSANLDVAINAVAETFELFGPIGSLFRDMLLDVKPDLIEIAVGGPR